MTTPRIATRLFVLVTIATGSILRADDEEPSTPAARLQRSYLQDAEAYRFVREDGDRTKLEMQRKPIMHWASDNDWSGDVFVWTNGGRPDVVGCILSGPRDDGSRLYYHEFHSLAAVPVTMTETAGTKKWSPREGVTFLPVKGAPAPAKSDRGRLVQLRALARSFTARMHPDDQEWTLRLLPQPLHRYADESAGVVDGAIFAFVWGTGTDPEFLIAIEARTGEDGETRWEYLPVRFTHRPLSLETGGEVVWSDEQHSEPSGDATGPYSTFYSHFTPAPPREADAGTGTNPENAPE